MSVDVDVEFELVGVGVDGRFFRGGEFFIFGFFAGFIANEGDSELIGRVGSCMVAGRGGR